MHLRQKVQSGQRCVGGMVFEVFTPGIAQIMAQAGCEYVIYEMEHAGASIETLKGQVAACKGGATPLARPPVGQYQYLARLLDIGMKGVMVPMVDSADEAAVVVEACRYPPEGRRGAAFGFQHDDYAPGAPADKMKKANDDILIIAQVETERALANVDAIAATPCVDVIWIGQFDLSNFLGVPGDFESKTYLDAWAEITAAARKHGKAMGAMAANPEWAADYAAQGIEMIAAGTDQGALISGFTAITAPAKGGPAKG